ncbi:MAG TPA: hypothetical protein VFQ65_00370 [Kofleriaceae bacterium]|nr:hypothetical protein [Kofleriaceae bacterium]
MSPWIVAALVVTCAVRRAQAERAIVIDEQGFALRGSAAEGQRGVADEKTIVAPFAAQELAAAIRVRIAPDGSPVRIRVTPTATGVRIETRGETRDVELGELRGADAARMVALVANDLLVDDLATPPPPLELPTRRAPPELGVLGGVSGWDGMLGGLTLDLAVPRDSWVMTFEAGGGELIDSTLHLLAGVVRIDPALRIDGFEVRAGVTLAPLLVTSGLGDQTVLAGANASVRMRLALTAGVHAVLAAGVDAYATHTQYQLQTMTVPTPWVAPWLCAGIEVGL